MTTQMLANQGKTTLYSNMAESVVHKVQGLRKEAMRGMFSDFNADKERLCCVATIRGVDYIDDSYAENVNSVWFALENTNKPIHWILNLNSQSITKDVECLRSWVDKKVKMIICIGENKEVENLLSISGIQLLNVKNIEEAIKVAYLCAEENQVVLYAPLFSASDLWESSSNRSLRFRKAVNEL